MQTVVVVAQDAELRCRGQCGALSRLPMASSDRTAMHLSDPQQGYDTIVN